MNRRPFFIAFARCIASLLPAGLIVLSCSLSLSAFAQPAATQDAPAAVEPESDDAQIGRVRVSIEQAQREHDEAMASFGPDHERSVDAMMRLASAYRARRQSASALEWYGRALAASERRAGPQHPRVADVLYSLSAAQLDTGAYDEALRTARRALAVRESALGPAHPATAFSLNQVAGTYRVMGQYEAARPLYEKALEIKEKSLGPDHPSTATTLNSLGLLYRNTAHYQKALPLYQRALAITERAEGPDGATTAVRLQNLAELYRLIGRYEQALPLYQRALQIREATLDPLHPRLAMTLANLAQLHEENGQTEQALPLMRRALSMREQSLGADHPSTAVSLASLAHLHLAARQPELAEPLFRRALEIRLARLGEAHPYTAQSMTDLSAAYLAQGQAQPALDLARRALAAAERAGSPEALWRALDGMRRVLSAQGRQASAIVFGKQAVNSLQALRARLADLDQESQRAFLRNKQEAYRQLIDLLVEADRLPEAQQVMRMLKEEEYFDFVRRPESDGIRATQAALTGPEQSWLTAWQTARARLESADTALRDARKSLPASLSPDERANRLAGLEGQQREADSACASQLDDAAHRHGAALADLQLQHKLARLGHGAVMLQYLITDGRVRLLLTTANGQVARESPTAASDLLRQVALFRDVLRYPERDPRPLARLLYRALIAPVEADLAQARARTLMLSLDGALRYLPMAALHDGERYLIERYALAVHTEAAASRLGEPPRAGWSVAGLGLTRAVDGFSALPAVRDEIRGILRATGQSGEAHFDDSFTAARLQKILQGKRPVLHISSHFVFRPGTDTDSYLLLGDGTRLSLRDFSERGYDFRRLDLLTLSACETAVGGGRDASGREIEGLGVLAQRQGAKGVLATLWPVADRSTSLLMQHLYRIRHSTPGISTAEALRQAQLILLQGSSAAPGMQRVVAGAGGASAQYAHPYFWAATILMGNWL